MPRALRGLSEEGNPAVIGFKTNADAMAENIQTLVDSYNSILHTANKYSDSQHQSVKLYRDHPGIFTELKRPHLGEQS